MVFEVGPGSGKTERGPLIVPRRAADVSVRARECHAGPNQVGAFAELIVRWIAALVPFRRVAASWFIHWRPRRLGCTRPLGQAKEPRARPMCPGDLLGDHGQRPIAPAVVFEPVLAHEDGMGVSAPLPHQRRACLQYDFGIERTSAFLELSR